MDDRLRLPAGGFIQRDKPITFRFNNRDYQGFEGDTLASALLAAGVRLTARSFKFHRPRGVTSAGVDEPSSIVELLGPEQSGNHPITQVALRHGLVARSVNCWPSANFDLMSVNQWFLRLLPAAFYYKTFMWPNWHLWEPAIRRLAGLARAPAVVPAAGSYETRYGHCDVLVVGAGPAGLMAARVAARAGCRVMLVDDGAQPGGRLLDHRSQIDGIAGPDWVARVVAELDSVLKVRRLQSTSVWAYREGNLLIMTQRHPERAGLVQRTWRVRAQQVVLATGANERPLVFPDNDRPGIMLASAAQAYLHRYAVRPGRRAVVFTNNSSAYEVAADLSAAGVRVMAIVDARTQIPTDALERVPGIEVLAGHVVDGTRGYRQLRAVRVRARESTRSPSEHRWLECDLLAISGGWNPVVHLYSQSRGELRYDDGLAALVPDKPAQPAVCAGAAAGVMDLPDVLADGAIRGRMAAQRCGREPIGDAPVAPRADAGPQWAIQALWSVDTGRPGDKAFVDLQHDVTVDDLQLAVREGYAAAEHAKRYTTAGMGFDQGKAGHLNVAGVLAQARQLPVQDVGTTTMRSPYVPVDFGALVGARGGNVFLPYRHTPITPWNLAHGAVMFEAGARWRRPGYYPRQGEGLPEALQRECMTVRNRVAIYDGSPLGKFEIRGSDARRLTEMLYTTSQANLNDGQGRYGLMLTDDGLILDDGVCFKLSENHYLLSTSTANADEVYRHIEHFLQIERPHWRVQVTPVTAAWANVTVCGPDARRLLGNLATDLDLSHQGFPFMGLRIGHIADIPVRVARVSFTGELSFEINAPASRGLELWETLLEAGAALGICPVGSEANHVLRVEKGFLSLGHEVDGTADPHDLGMGWAMSQTKPDFLGKRAVEIRRSSGRVRRELVGLLTDDPARQVIEGAPITPGGRREASEGFVSACVHSPVMARSVALGLLSNGRARHGEKVHIRMKNEIVPATVTLPCFYDPSGHRMRS